MTADPAEKHPTAYDIKSADLPLVALCLHTTDLTALTAALQAEFGDNPEFFDNDALLIDLSHLHAPQQAEPDFAGLCALLRRYRTAPVALKGGTPAQQQAAQAAGLLLAHDARLVQGTTTVQTVVQEVIREVPIEAPAPAPMVVDRPLRSGQKVYAKGADLIVLAMVNAGAEVIADGHIHVYAPLRGKAIAGARGDTSARIFTLCLDPELVSVAGMYRTSEHPLPDNVRGKPAQIRLVGEKLIFEPLNA